MKIVFYTHTIFCVRAAETRNRKRPNAPAKRWLCDAADSTRYVPAYCSVQKTCLENWTAFITVMGKIKFSNNLLNWLVVKAKVRRSISGAICGLATCIKVLTDWLTAQLRTRAQLPVKLCCLLGAVYISSHFHFSYALVSINEVKIRRARLILGWVTVSGFDSRGRYFISVCKSAT